MQLPRLLSIITLAGSATAASVSYDEGYDDAGRSLISVSCSDGANGLMTRFGWQTQGDVATFPNIGGVPAVAGWNSPSCGSCWRLEYEGNVVKVLAVDASSSGFNIGMTSMDALTNGMAYELGRVEATATEVGVAECGIEDTGSA